MTRKKPSTRTSAPKQSKKTSSVSSKPSKSIKLRTTSAKLVKNPDPGLPQKLVQVNVKLSEAQKADIEKLTGKKVQTLRLTVEDLADLANVLLN